MEGRAKVNHGENRGSPCQRRVSMAMVGLDVNAGEVTAAGLDMLSLG